MADRLTDGEEPDRQTGRSNRGLLKDEIAALSSHPLFNADWYLSTYPDVKDSGMAAPEHFLRHGLFEGRDRGPKFKTLAWFAANPEALAARRNPLLEKPADQWPERP